MNILFIEPFYGPSHQQFIDGLQVHSQHNIQLLTLSGHHWKWRMHGAAHTLARQYMDLNFKADIIMATDMLDFATFLALTRKKSADIPTILYMHENQLTYPWSATDQDVKLQRDNHYAWINWTSALAADHIWFNSSYHLNSFIDALPPFLAQFPDHQEGDMVARLRQKAEVQYVGLEFSTLHCNTALEVPNRAVLLWNHRWEYDKNPDDFFKALFELQDRGIDFRLNVLGQSFKNQPAIFAQAKEQLADKILHWGFAESKEAYVQRLNQSDILPVTSNQEFYGISVLEAMYCNVKPLLPNRLSYTEHIPELYRQGMLYESHEDFVNRLQRLIMNVRVIRKQQTRHIVERYDWSQRGPLFDEAFARLG